MTQLTSLRLAALAGVGSLAITTTATAEAQPPPISDADREAARELFKDGAELQRGGHYAEALDRFRRSQQVYPAPTALLHIAECEAQLNHLVSAAETYRALGRQQLAADAPAAFQAAQAQGAAELQQIEPLIPHVLIDVRPANIPNLAVQIDGQPMNTALLDVARAVDPGQHKISASAPGFGGMEALVTVAEKEPPKKVTLTLTPMAGVAAMPLPVPMGVPMSGPQPQYVVMQPPPGYVVQGPPPGYLPPPPPSYYVTPRPLAARTGIFVGPRFGAVLPEGSSDFTNAVGPGFSLGAEFDLRFARYLFVGAVVEHGFLSVPSSLGCSACSASTTNFDVQFGVLTSPDHFAALFVIGGGYRTVTQSVPSAGPFGGSDLSASASSPEFLLGAGLWIPTGSHFRIVPRIDGTFGSLSSSNSSSGSGQGYAMVTFDLGGYFNFDFH